LHRCVLHKLAIQALDFSSDGEYLASLGAQDDNSVGVWETATGRAVCGVSAGPHAALCVAWAPGRNDKLYTGGMYLLRAWDFNHERRRLFPEDLKVGAVKRVYTALTVSADGERLYAGSSSGDILQFATVSGLFVQQSSHRFSQGVLALRLLGGALLAGTGDGALARLDAGTLKVGKAAELMGGITSLAVSPDATSAFCGCNSGSIYGVNLATLETQLRNTAPASPITDLCFPAATSDLFLTASGSDIRVWHTRQRRELLRIQVPGPAVLCLALNGKGSLIVSGWDDGKVRAFSPESGKLLWTITDAHSGAVSAVAFTHKGDKLVTGGADGRVRTWALGARAQSMELSFKEHKKQVTSIKVSANDEEALSSSTDGSCVVWNLRRGVRTSAVFASTVFREIAYHPDESQLLTCGSDRKLTYWDTADATALRAMDGSVEEVRAPTHKTHTQQHTHTHTTHTRAAEAPAPLNPPPPPLPRADFLD
jgi:WD40 repeat protein